MNGFNNNCSKEGESQSIRLGRELDNEIKSSKDLCNIASDLSLKNYSDWREYLHKYYLLMLIVAGGLGVYEKSGQNSIKIGLGLIVTGVLIGFIIINLYLYWERKHIRFSYDVDITKPYQWFKHPKIKESNPPLAMRLNLQEIIKKNRLLLKSMTKKEDRKVLKGKIKADTRWLRGIKYWNMYGFEKAWIVSISISLILTFVGIILIFINL